MPPAADDSTGVAVVADDLTGAADTAVHFLPRGQEMLLLSLARDAAGPAGPTGAGLAIDTATRGSGPEETTRAVQRAAALVHRLRPALIYKKVDSQLRGRPGLEIETLRRALGRRCALVAPAHPDQGRVTRGGVHLVHGVPVAEAEAGRDPVAPVMESRLPALLAGQAGVDVAHVGAADLDAGPAFLRRTIERFLAEGSRLITFDATHPSHLELIAEVASRRFPDALVAGSAGLAMALAACRRSGPAERPVAPRCESMLFVCGSTAAALHRQVTRLVTSRRCVAVTATRDGLTAEARRDELRKATVEAWTRCDVVLQTPEDRLDPATCPPAAILAGLAGLFVELVERRRPDGLFLSGGDTARALLAAAGVDGVRLRGEASPGVAWGLAVGGMLDGVTVLTRSGAFGGDEGLVALHDRCRKGATHG